MAQRVVFVLALACFAFSAGADSFTPQTVIGGPGSPTSPDSDTFSALIYETDLSFVTSPTVQDSNGQFVQVSLYNSLPLEVTPGALVLCEYGLGVDGYCAGPGGAATADPADPTQGIASDIIVFYTSGDNSYYDFYEWSGNSIPTFTN